MASWEEWDTWEPSQDYPQAPPARSKALGDVPAPPADQEVSSSNLDDAGQEQQDTAFGEQIAASLGFVPPEPVDDPLTQNRPSAAEAASFFDQFSRAVHEQNGNQTLNNLGLAGGITPGVQQITAGTNAFADATGNAGARNTLDQARIGAPKETANAHSAVPSALQELISGWKEIPQSPMGETKAKHEPASTLGLSDNQGRPKVQANIDTKKDNQRPTVSNKRNLPVKGQNLKGASGSSTEKGKEKERNMKVRRVGTPGQAQARDYNIVLLSVIGILVLLIGVGFGTMIGMNLAPQVRTTISATPDFPEEDYFPTQQTPSASPQDRANQIDPAKPYSPLRGMKIALDPGHNGGNAPAWQQINAQVPDGRGNKKACDTTGTATNDGYSEAQFNWEVVTILRKKLEDEGAQVFLTRQSNTGVGPCVDERGRLSQTVDAEAIVHVHANGTLDSSVNGFFAMISDPPLNDSQGKKSLELAQKLVEALKNSGFKPQQTYPGGIFKRSDLATLNFAQRPAVMLELGEMRNPADSALMKTEEGRNRYAQAIFDGIRAWANEKHPAPPAPSQSAPSQSAPAQSAPAPDHS